jgi:hypothetical protein
MLSDSSISLSKLDRRKEKYSMTMDIYSLNYLNETIYSQFIDIKIYAYPQIYFLNIKIRICINFCFI